MGHTLYGYILTTTIQMEHDARSTYGGWPSSTLQELLINRQFDFICRTEVSFPWKTTGGTTSTDLPGEGFIFSRYVKTMEEIETRVLHPSQLSNTVRTVAYRHVFPHSRPLPACDSAQSRGVKPSRRWYAPGNLA